LDPKNVFGINNTIYRSEEEEREDLEDHWDWLAGWDNWLFYVKCNFHSQTI
jgi:hypothetical protein